VVLVVVFMRLVALDAAKKVAFAGAVGFSLHEAMSLSAFSVSIGGFHTSAVGWGDERF
jgi:hypothetical protein